MSSYFLPIPLTPGDKGKEDSVKKERPYKIFFKDLFLFKENEVAAKKKEKIINRSMRVYQKSTFSSRMKSRSHLGQRAFYSDTAGDSFEKFGLDPTLILRLTEGADTKRTIHEFINDQRDRFLLEYALSTKRNTIKKFEKLIAVKEQQLIKAEKKLQEDAMAFEEFLRENDQRSVDALKIAAQETINKLQITAELKKANMEVQAVKSLTESISSEDSLEFFLDDDMDYDLEPELYFKEPEELLQVLTELEEQNLTLVQYSQDVDESLEDINKREKLIQDKINSNIAFLLEHKEMLKANCVREEEKAADLELRSRLFSFGEFKSDAQEKLIESLSKKINQVYKVCIGDADVGSLNPVQKLVKVESRLVELSDLIESIPKENVETIERIKQKERRQKLREDKMKEKQRHQEERLKAALERAVAQPKKKLGRRLTYRSKPPSGNKHELLLVKDTRTKSLEEEYFFT
ncbi:coiled-coil domain-containing protein 38 isoform X3 [Panthera tigris]|uniref:coiled-coil domain-containing protein 38 isoform X3 n=1 Tax=Panthera leo TaxID=9689 RepID=UPI001C697525|nr:coiled-coil domain-containing protein 38 isoform X3 [Panthera leo]XP_042848876.1 coiled-coil domain-containing protein 38 isoform X3 [Panthera tigris]